MTHDKETIETLRRIEARLKRVETRMVNAFEQVGAAPCEFTPEEERSGWADVDIPAKRVYINNDRTTVRDIRAALGAVEAPTGQYEIWSNSASPRCVTFNYEDT